MPGVAGTRTSHRPRGPIGQGAGAALKASTAGVEEAIASGDLAALGKLLADSAGMLLREAVQLSRDAHEIRSEVLLTATGLAGSPRDVLGLLLPWPLTPWPASGA